MDIQVKRLEPSDLRPFMRTLVAAFSDERQDEDKQDERWSKLLPMDRAFGAFDGNIMVGTAAAFAFNMSIPGGEAPTGAVTMVGVLASHRRRGVATKLMRAQLEDLRDRGEALAALWASEAHIYPRFGYGLATLSGDISMNRDRARFLADTPPQGSYRLLDEDEALKVLPEIYERVYARTPGMMTRTEDWWKLHRLYDHKSARGGSGPLMRAVWEDEGRAEAYVLYRLRQKWQDAVARGETEVMELIATSPRAHTEMWRYVIGVDLAEKISYWVLPDRDPLWLKLAEMRRLQWRVHDGIWVRVVDAETALGIRSYSADGRTIVELIDDFCPWNAGRYEIVSERGTASVTRTDAEPDITLGAVELGSIYLGTFTVGDLYRAGRVEGSDDAIARATAMFRSEVPPWNPEIF